MTTKKLAVLAFLAAVPLALAGCATIFTGTTDTLSFQANVPGVRLTVDGRYLGELPLRVPMSRNFMGGQQFIARFEAPGYQLQEFVLKREFNYVTILDVSSPLTSGGIDVLSGSMLRFSPTDYHVQMLPEGESASSPEFRRGVAVHGLALTSWRSVQKDVARGGGADLANLAAAIAATDPAKASLVEAAALRHAPELLAAASGHDFVARIDGVLASEPGLSGLRL